MSKVNDLKNSALATATGLVGSAGALEADWLRRIKGRSGNTLEQLWTQEFIAVLGSVSGNFNMNAMAYLGSLGHTGTLPARWQQFWAAL